MRAFVANFAFIASVVLAVVGVCFLPVNAMKDITTELMAFFSIQSAVILPAMIFTAGILKPDGLEIADADRYHRALKAQMLFWVVLLSLDFISVVTLILGKALGWSFIITIPYKEYNFDLGYIVCVVFYFSGSLAVFRTVPFVRGVISLLDLNSEMITKAIRRRNKKEAEQELLKAAKATMQLPEGYGAVIEAHSSDT